MNAAGVASMKWDPEVNVFYRAVAAPSGRLPEAVSKPGSLAWTTYAEYGFNETGLTGPWNYYNTGNYLALNRACSAPSPSTVRFTGRTVDLGIAKETSAEVKAGQKAACARAINAQPNYSARTKRALIGKTPIYRNSMVSTKGKFRLRTGVVAARVKFPQNTGMHSAVVLLSGELEIDIVEAWGTSKKLTQTMYIRDSARRNVAHHLRTLRKPNAEWWDRYHTVSVELTPELAVFRVDGEVTATSAVPRPRNETVFIVLSNLTSDWELGRLDDARLGSAKLKVDWVKTWSN